MTPNCPQTAKAFLQSVFTALLDPNVSSADVGQYFSPDYQQLVDGKTLDFEAFMNHVDLLKNTLVGGTATFDHLLVNGDTWAGIHHIDALKQDGRHIRTKVLAFYTLKHGKISRVEELTHLEKGDAADHDLGSRLSS